MSENLTLSMDSAVMEFAIVGVLISPNDIINKWLPLSACYPMYRPVSTGRFLPDVLPDR